MALGPPAEKEEDKETPQGKGDGRELMCPGDIAPPPAGGSQSEVPPGLVASSGVYLSMAHAGCSFFVAYKAGGL